MKGSRVQNVVQELQGERIDIVTWSPDPAKYVYNALAPAHVSMVRVDEDSNSMLVVVPNDQLSLAIGRQGQNVRLASRLLGWRIDVKSEQRWNNLQDPGYQSILALPGVEESLADQIIGKGIFSVVNLAGRSVEELLVIRSLDEATAAKLIEAAKNALSRMTDEEREEIAGSGAAAVADEPEEAAVVQEPSEVEQSLESDASLVNESEEGEADDAQEREPLDNA
jgi:N utilization substance protein A